MDVKAPLGPAVLCEWFAGVFFRELSLEQMQIYGRGGFKDLAAELEKAIGLPSAGPLEEIKGDIKRWQHSPSAELELATDFASLFLASGPGAPLPYASYYTTKGRCLFDAPHERMLERLETAGLAMLGECREPADHLSLQLSYLAELYASDQPLEAPGAFIASEMMEWVPLFTGDVARTPTKFGFHKASLKLLNAFLKQEV
ncbi:MULTISPECIES: molecular chaperone TorD family protein [Pseudovibrio]|uniref:molecular chaperone TorD family protein n=1 Tax=Stappiaceae TaxID=2821832 RepID=UPI002366B94E|nr:MULTISPECIES: molecular chaperone TorD family protein [Pseudovibrio]MDD7908463.1 molecular chaperone TorD family protein [Pseudovibrio exalbescens]MDX5592663.1 molecular chaperone TorD family protein [Pseudovibrio sp. SPO723]